MISYWIQLCLTVLLFLLAFPCHSIAEKNNQSVCLLVSQSYLFIKKLMCCINGTVKTLQYCNLTVPSFNPGVQMALCIKLFGKSAKLLSVFCQLIAVVVPVVIVIT